MNEWKGKRWQKERKIDKIIEKSMQKILQKWKKEKTKKNIIERRKGENNWKNGKSEGEDMWKKLKKNE